MSEEFENEKKKEQIFFDLPERGNLKPRFLVIFLPIIWIFMESDEPKIKSKQALKEIELCAIMVYRMSIMEG